MAPFRSTLNSAYLWTKVLIRTHPGPFIGGAFTVTGALAGSFLLVLESRAGRREAAKDLSTKFEHLDRKIDTIEKTTQEVKKVVEDNKRMIFTTAHHTMTALSGNKKPMQLFLADIEKCIKSGRGDCGITAA